MRIGIYLCFLVSLNSCEKYLDHKVLASQFIPSSLDDLQALLDNPPIYSSSPALLELVADNYYVSSSTWSSQFNSLPDAALNYMWSPNSIPHNISWNAPYQQPVYYSNVILDNLQKIKINEADKVRYNEIKGSALFHRAFSFFQLAQLFCLPYSEENRTSPGIVLRTTSDINSLSIRSSVEDVYNLIISNLKESIELLPEKSIYPTRPTKVAALGFLARIYLSMRNYVNAKKYANECLLLKNDLIDFNTLIPIGAPPIRSFNDEVIFHNTSSNASILSTSNAKIDSMLIRSYVDGDLRKEVFFRPNTGANVGTFSFRGSYHGNGNVGSIFTGITTSEIYFIRAECNAREGLISESLSDLNIVMEKRWRNNGSWTPITSNDVNDVLNKVLFERRKEMVFRGLRWTDLRRFNLDVGNITLQRNIDGTSYYLPPNDKRWVMLIPFDVINKSGITQNPR